MPRFTNLDGSTPQPFGNVFKWAVFDRVTGKRSPDRRPFAPPRFDHDGALLRDNARDPLATWIGHATWVVQLAGANVVIDPIWARAIGGVVKRLSAPGLALDQLPELHAVLVTHNHRDHMDAPSLEALRHVGRAIVPRGLGPAMKKLGYGEVVELDWWQTTRVRDASVTFVPSQHWSRRGLFDANETLWGGFVIEGDGKRVYHSGDTAYFDGFARIRDQVGAPDVALLPIGAYEPEWFMRRQHMNPDDALQAARDLSAGHVLPMHWGTYQLTDEAMSEPPARFLRLVAEDPVFRDRVSLVPIGGMHRF